MRISDWSSDVCSSDLLLDCEKMAKVWRREDAEHGEKHKVFRNQVQEIPGLWRRLAGVWNARDHEYQPGVSKLLHYTTLQTQPWRPFPKVDRKSTRLNSSH